ncbi:MAG: hypothetical protein OWS74_09510 [Firmicutes bacterium]|nr:hypothetical protein [Bacillota bacterium]
MKEPRINENLVRWTRHTVQGLSWVIQWIILLMLVGGMIGFFINWGGMLIHPWEIEANLRNILDALFGLVLLIETRDLLHYLEPTRLLDIVATVLTRRIVLASSAHAVLLNVVAVTLILLARGVWVRYLQPTPVDKAESRRTAD